MSTLEIQRRKVSQGGADVVILDLQGSLDAHTAPKLDEILTELSESGSYRLIISFSKLDYISSAGMGLFVGWIDNFRTNGGDILMISLKQNVLRVFKILGFDKIFGIHEDEGKAIIKFG